MTNTEIIATMSRCVCGTRIRWTQNQDNIQKISILEDQHHNA